MKKLHVSHRRPDIDPDRLAEVMSAAVESVRAKILTETGEDVEIEAVDSLEGMVEGRDLIYIPDTLREWAELNATNWDTVRELIPEGI